MVRRAATLHWWFDIPTLNGRRGLHEETHKGQWDSDELEVLKGPWEWEEEASHRSNFWGAYFHLAK